MSDGMSDGNVTKSGNMKSSRNARPRKRPRLDPETVRAPSLLLDLPPEIFRLVLERCDPISTAMLETALRPGKKLEWTGRAAGRETNYTRERARCTSIAVYTQTGCKSRYDKCAIYANPSTTFTAFDSIYQFQWCLKCHHMRNFWAWYNVRWVKRMCDLMTELKAIMARVRSHADRIYLNSLCEDLRRKEFGQWRPPSKPMFAKSLVESFGISEHCGWE